MRPVLLMRLYCLWIMYTKVFLMFQDYFWLKNYQFDSALYSKKKAVLITYLYQWQYVCLPLLFHIFRSEGSGFTHEPWAIIRLCCEKSVVDKTCSTTSVLCSVLTLTWLSLHWLLQYYPQPHVIYWQMHGFLISGFVLMSVEQYEAMVNLTGIKT